MKKVFIIIFDDDKEMSIHTEKVIEKFKKSDALSVFCGSWGKIHYNKEQCLNSIANAVNHYIKSPEKKDVYFGCNCKDVAEIKPLLILDDCKITDISYSDFIKQ